jgi:hypothetical protein
VVEGDDFGGEGKGAELLEKMKGSAGNMLEQRFLPSPSEVQLSS